MKKYFVIFKNSLQANLVYRFNTFALFLSEGLSLLVFVYLWMSIYYQGNQMGNYTFKGLIIYYIFSKFVILTVNASDVSRLVGDAIREGKIVSFLTKPLNFLRKELFYYLGGVVYKFIVFTPIFLLAIFLFFKDINFGGLPLLLFWLFVFIAIIINFLIQYIVGILAFYFGSVFGLSFAAFTISHFLSGSLVPVDLFPPVLLTVTKYLPFKFIVFVPISIITGRIEMGEIFPLLGTSLVWIIVLYLSANILYKKGLNKYEAYGI